MIHRALNALPPLFVIVAAIYFGGRIAIWWTR